MIEIVKNSMIKPKCCAESGILANDDWINAMLLPFMKAPTDEEKLHILHRSVPKASLFFSQPSKVLCIP